MLYAFGRYSLDSARFELYRDGIPLALEPLVFRLLLFLIENRDRVVPRSEIHRRLWGKRFVTDNALTVLVRSARNVLDDSGGAQAIIKTFHGTGYRFVAGVNDVSRSLSMTRCDVVSAQTSIDRRTDSQAAIVDDRALAGQPSLAVLRFASISGNEAETVFARGFAHDLITRIARSRTMLIIARGSAFKFATDDHDVVEIGRKLGVRYVVQGAVQIEAKRLRIFVSLANALTGEELWSDQFVRAIDDFMLIQQDVADIVVGLVETNVQQEEIHRSLLAPSANLDAWSLFHRGLHHLYRFKTKDCDRAERYFRQSIELEPDMARPYAGLSFVHFERVFMNFGGRRAEGVARALDYAGQCLALDPSDPMGHWVLARANLLRAELAASRSSLEKAIEINPSYANAKYSLGWVAMHIGENELCTDSISSAIRLSPYDPFMYAMQGVMALNLAMVGRAEEAISLARQSMQQPNRHYQVGAFAAVSYALCGEHETAREMFTGVRSVAPEYDADQFLSVFPFQRESDIQRIHKAFAEILASSRPH